MSTEVRAFAQRQEVRGKGFEDLLSHFLVDVEPKLENDSGYMLAIVEQAQLLFREFYAHLRFKEELHAVDPVRRLDLLRLRLQQTSEAPLAALEFHRQMAQTFVAVRDRHMSYSWPAPFKRRWAWLGIEVEECWEGESKVIDELEKLDGSRGHSPAEIAEARELQGDLREKLRRCYVVSRVHPEYEDQFQKGDEVRYWNGVPIERAVELSAQRQPGSNDEASRAVGLTRMTLVPLSRAAPPDAHFVEVGYRRRTKSGRARRLCARLAWRVLKYPRSSDRRADTRVSAGPFEFGVDFAEDKTHRIMAYLHAVGDDSSGLFRAEELLDRNDRDEPSPFDSHFHFTYLRIFSFSTKDVADVLQRIRSEVHRRPQSGLVVDIRDNPGGAIPLAELLLAALTSLPVEFERFQFPATPATSRLCNLDSELIPPRIARWQNWGGSIERSSLTGERHSQALPVTEALPPFAREPFIFYGPLVLVTNARSYSASDMFAAGFRDNRLGTILGTHDNTGAGGANVVRHKDLHEIGRQAEINRRLGLSELPAGTRRMSVAIRRSLRVGDQAGTPLEDLGVAPDQRHFVTARDLTRDNVDLKRRVARILLATEYLLFAKLESAPGQWTLAVKLKGLRPKDLEFSLLREGPGPIDFHLEPGDSEDQLQWVTDDWPFGGESQPAAEVAEVKQLTNNTLTARVVIRNLRTLRFSGVWIRAVRDGRIVAGFVLPRSEAVSVPPVPAPTTDEGRVTSASPVSSRDCPA